MVSSSSFLSELKTARIDPEAAPRLMVGAASPLWLMFGGAAAAGATWWWWASRWREAVNLEAVLAATPEPVATPVPAPEALAMEAVETLEASVETVMKPATIVAETAVEAVEAVVETVEAANDTMVETVEALIAEAPLVEVSPIVEASTEVVKAAVDDLTRVVGIGPKLAASLRELGVTSFSQMAAWTSDELQSIDQLLNLKGRASRDAWIAQAKRFSTPEA